MPLLWGRARMGGFDGGAPGQRRPGHTLLANVSKRSLTNIDMTTCSIFARRSSWSAEGS